MGINNLLNIDDPSRDPQRGDLLISEPLLKEDYFDRAVILILDIDNQGGTMGLALNKKTALTLGDILDGWEAGKNVPIFCGGPVELTRLFMLHSLGDIFPGSLPLGNGLYIGGKIEDIVEYIENEGEVEGKIRFFLGYSGWLKEQLAQELNQGVWAVRDSGIRGHDLISGAGNDFWRNEVKKMGNKYRSWLIVPQDPAMN